MPNDDAQNKDAELKLSSDEARVLIKAIEELEKEEAAAMEKQKAA